MAEDGDVPEAAGGYLQVHESQHRLQNGCITISFLRRPSANEAVHVPSWESFMREEVVQITTKLVNKGWHKPNSSFTISADSGLANGLALKLQIDGIEVPEDNKKHYVHRMKQYLKKMSKAVHVSVQTARDESSSLGGQGGSQASVPTVDAGQFQPASGSAIPHVNGIYCSELSHFGCIAAVPRSVPLQQDCSIARLYEGSGHIPSAFVPTTSVPLSYFQTSVPLFVPQCSFQPYVIPWSLLNRGCVNFMIATPDFPGTDTGLIPFLFVDYDVSLFLQIISPWAQRVRIYPPVLNRRALVASPPNSAADESADAVSSSSDSSAMFNSSWASSTSHFPALPSSREADHSGSSNTSTRAWSSNTNEDQSLDFTDEDPFGTFAGASFQASSTTNNQEGQ